MSKTKAININDIVLDERCQARAVLNPEAVQEYADIYREGEVNLPALSVVLVDGQHVLIDGFHRLAGARQADHGFIRVEVVERECDDDRARWLASAVNQGHGVRRTNADKRQAVKLAIGSAIGEEQSLRVIAEHVGVHHSFVAKVKSELSTNDTPKTDPEPEPTPHELDDSEGDDMYHTAARRIGGCYRKVCAILGEDDDICETLFRALEMAKEREL